MLILILIYCNLSLCGDDYLCVCEQLNVKWLSTDRKILKKLKRGLANGQTLLANLVFIGTCNSIGQKVRSG